MKRCLNILLGLVMVTACSSPAPSQQGYVSLHPAITETLFALGAGNQLIGRSDYCTHPVEAHKLPTFGTTLTPQVEALASLQPKFILVDESFGSKNDLLSELAPIQSFPWLTLDQVASSTQRLGKLVDAEEKAAHWVSEYKAHLGGEASEDAPRAILIMGTGSSTAKELWYIKPDSLHGSALTAAGLRNAIPKGIQGPPSLSVEQLITYDPDVLIVMAPGDSDSNQAVRASLEQITPLKAVRNGQIHIISGENLMGIGPGIIEFAKQLKTLRKSL